MYWQEDNAEKAFEVDENVLDVMYQLECKSLPVDHNQLLYDGISDHAPWIEDEPFAALHSIHVAESTNGWERPTHESGGLLHLSRRTRLTIRVPQHKLNELNDALVGKVIRVGDFDLHIKKMLSTKKLLPISTVFSRYVVSHSEDEEAFMESCAKEISALGIKIKKMLAGKKHHILINGEAVLTRTLMLADLSKEESIILQQNGIGAYQHIGCGIFIPHKGIEAVNKGEEEKS